MPNFVQPENNPDGSFKTAKKMYVDKDFHIKYNNAVFPQDNNPKERFVTHKQQAY